MTPTTPLTPRPPTTAAGKSSGRRVHPDGKAVREGRRSRGRLVLLAVAVQAGLLLAGTYAAIRELAISADRANEMMIVAGALGVAILGLTGLATASLMRRHDEDMDAINAGLEAQVRGRVEQAMGTRDALISGLAKLAEFRDSDTGAHLDRIAAYSALLARAMRQKRPEITEDWIAMLRVASSMHDIGKVGIADAVLLKPGRLTQEERQQMQQHPAFGTDTLILVRERMGPDPLIEMSIRVTLYHHERWDGTGYPMKLAGTQIPLEARILALADVYDALTSRRSYKEPIPHAAAAGIIRDGTGTHFDPEVVEAFGRVEGEFDGARERMRTGEVGPGAGPGPGVGGGGMGSTSIL